VHSLALALLSSAVTCHSVLAQDPVPPVFPGEPASGPIEVRGTGGVDERWFATRLVDAHTGEVVLGEITAYGEPTNPDEAPWPTLRTVESDAEGWVRMRIDDLKQETNLWLVAEARDHAPASASSPFPPLPWILERGFDVPIEVQDALGKPIEGAQVGWRLGSGPPHNMGQAVTDSAGRATLSSVDTAQGEIWVRGRQLRGTQTSLRAWAPGRARLIVACDPAHTYRGFVLDADGAPCSKAKIRLSDPQRGPWLVADAAGRFVLEGLEGELVMVIGADPGEVRYFELPPSGEEARFVLPRSGEDAPYHDRPQEKNLAIVFRLPARARDQIPITAWCAALRYREGFSHDLEGGESFTASLPPGSYELRFGGKGSGWREKRIRLELPTRGVASSAIELQSSPRVRMWLDLTSPFAKELGNAGDIELVTATWSRSIAQDVLEGRAIVVPEEDEWAVRLRIFDLVRHVERSRVNERRELELTPLEPHRVRVRFADAFGRPVIGSAKLAKHVGAPLRSEAESPASGIGEGVELATWLGPGRWPLHCTSGEQGWRAPQLHIDVELPESTAEVVDAGEVRFAPAHERGLMLRMPDGSPAKYVKVDLDNVGYILDEEGRLSPFAEAGPGDIFYADLDDGVTLPLRAVLGGAGPWELRWPTGALELEVSAEEGGPVESFALHLDGAVHVGRNGRLSLRGVPGGKGEAIVAARGFAPARMHLDFDREEVVTASVILRPR
jgi:hypothetical protein